MSVIGFIGLGVMGEPMCRNLARKSGMRVIGFDHDSQPLARLAADGVARAESLEVLTAACDYIFLALPGGQQVEDICTKPDGLLTHVRRGTLVVDLGTSPVDLTLRLVSRFVDKGVRYVDAPIARTRQAAVEGTLSIMVGADERTFAELQPVLALMASDITHCGAVGAGHVTKILNNMVLMETVVALSEAVAIARKFGLDDVLFFNTLMKGSADSFALRNHGMKAILPGLFPERAFSTEYARKDMSYALALAHRLGVDARGAKTADDLLGQSSKCGFGQMYWPVLSRIIGENLIPGDEGVVCERESA